MTAAAHMLPNLSDRLLTSTFFMMAKGGEKRRGKSVNLHEPGRDGDQFGDGRFMRRTSLYTAAQTHPRLTLGLGLAAGVAAAAVASGALRGAGGGRALRRLRAAA